MMKYLWTILILLTLAISVNAEDYTVTNSEYITVSGTTTDTLGRKPLVPDSIHIFIVDSAQTTLHNAAYISASAQATIDGVNIIFSDQWNDLNGAAEIGIFHMTVTIWSDADNNIDVSSSDHYTIRGVTIGTNALRDSLTTVLADANKGNLKATDVNVSSVDDDAINLLTDVTNQLQDSNMATISVNVTVMSADVITASAIATNAIGSSELATNAIGADQIAADAIGSSELASNAIGADEIATDAIGAAELAASAVDEIVDSTWDEILTGATHNIATSAGRKLRDVSHIIIAEGTAQRGTSLGIVLASATTLGDNILNGNIVSIVGGTGEGQSRHIHDYTGSTDSITLHAGDEWAVNPDVTSIYVIEPDAQSSVIHVDDSALVDIKFAVWDSDTTGHTTGGTQGYANTHGTPASISAGDIVAIVDTFFNRDSSDVNAGGATSFGTLMMKPAYVQGSATLTKEEIADAVLDSIEVGTRSPSYVSITVNNPSGDAVTYTSSGGNGDGMQITGTGTGSGLSAVGGTNGDGMFLKGVGVGSGLYVEATGTGDAVSFVATAGNGDGLSVTGFGTGDGIKALGGSTSGSGFRGTGFGVGHGFVLQGGATGSGMIAIGGANGNGFLLRGQGTGIGLRAEATGTGDGVLFIATAGNGDGFAVTGNGSGNGFLATGGATGDGGEFRGGATSGAGFRAWADGTNDTGFIAQGIGSGPGTSFRGGTSGNGFKIIGNAGMIISGLSGDGVQFISNGGNGDGLQIAGNGTGNGILALSGSGATGSGARFQAMSTNGDGLKLVGTGTGEEITSSGLVAAIWGADTSSHVVANSFGLGQGQGGAAAGGLDTLSTAFQLRLATLMADTAWLSLLADRDGVAGSFGDSAKDWKSAGGGLDTLSDAYRDDLLALINDTIELSHGTGDYGKGDGSDKLAFIAVDTTGNFATPGSGTPTENVTITVRNASNTVVAILETDGNGLDTASLNVGAAYSYTAAGPAGYTWVAKSIASMATGIDTVFGQNFLPPSSPPGDPSFAFVFGFVRSHDNSVLFGRLDGVEVMATRVGGENATTDDTTWIVRHTPEIAFTDTTGYFQFKLMRTGEYSDTTMGFYDIVGKYDGEQVFYLKSLHVPATGSVNVSGRISARTN